MLRPQATAHASFKDVAWMDTPASGIPLKVNSPEGTLYAMLQTQAKCECAADESNDKFLLLSLHHVKNGQIELPISPNARAASIKDFLQYRAQGKSDALLYKVNTSDLRNVKFTAVPAVWK